MIKHDLALSKLNTFLEAFVTLDPKRQRWLMTAISRKADSLNRKRVTRQVQLSGDKYKGRKNKAKKKMFLKLKQRRNMVIRVDGATAVIGYKGIMGRIAYEHHHGVKIPREHRTIGSTIGRGRKHRAKGTDPCTHEQAGILFSFLRLNPEGLDPAPKVSMKQVRAAEEKETGGRNKRKAIMKLFQSAYKAAEAGRTIALWDMAVSRVVGSSSPYYELPSRHLLGVSADDLPVLLEYAEQRLTNYLQR